MKNSNIPQTDSNLVLDLDWVVRQIPLSLFLGWNPPGQSDMAKFVAIKIDDIEVDVSRAIALPAKNGIVVPMGKFQSNNTYLVKWSCEAGLYSFNASVGYFKDDNINTRVILTNYPNIDYNEKWKGSGEITI